MSEGKSPLSIAEFMKQAELVKRPVETDGVLNVEPACCACGAALAIDEMHYLALGDGRATCCACEEKWSADVAAWRSSKGPEGEFPSRPGRFDKFPEDPESKTTKH